MSEEPNYEENDDLFEHHRIVVDPNQGALRIDKFLMDKMSNVTRNRIQSGIKDGFVKVNDTRSDPMMLSQYPCPNLLEIPMLSLKIYL